MPNTRTFSRSFNGGELSPEMFGRLDDVKFQTGAAKIRNMLVTPQGPAQNRPGTKLVREVKDSTKKTRLIPFTYSTTQTMVIELGAGYIRFHTQGATLLSGGVPYEIVNPYAESDLFDIHYVQSGDVLTLVHPSYAPRELRRIAATNWTLTTISFAPSIASPTGVSVTAYRGESVNITAITQANPGSITTASNHQLAAGDGVYISGIGGMTQFVDGFYTVNTAGTNTLTVKDYNTGVPVNTTAYSAYTSGGSIQFGDRIADIDNYYVVTASDGSVESTQSSAVNVVNNIYVNGSYNVIAWSAVSGAARYNVYKRQSGLYGYIGQTSGTSFTDNNIAPDMGMTPPLSTTVFASSGNYPGAVSYFEQRRIFAGTNNSPQELWMTRSGTESDMSYSIPVKDSDRINLKVAAREANTIRHVVPLTQMILLTNSAEWRVTSVNSDALTPTSISVRPQSYIGANNVQPSIVNNSLVYCAARGGHVRELGYSWQANGFITGDLSLRATHLFDNYEIVDMAQGKSPHPLLWFVSNNGNLLGLTYVPEQQIGAWHQHDTDGAFETCCVVSEGEEDYLYVVVKRTIGGTTRRYVERMQSQQFDSLEESFYMDCGLTYDGTNTGATTVTVSGGTTWGPADVLTVTASTPIFAYPATTDVNDAIVITASDGTKYRIKITGTSSTTVAVGIIDAVLPVALRGVATAAWAFARDSVSGLGHLEGKTVSILSDGAVMPQKVVTGGVVTLDRAGVLIHVGLPYQSDLQTLPLALNIDGYGQGRYKNVNKVWLRVYRSSGIFVGPDPDNLVEAKQRSTETYGTPPSLKTDEILVVLTPTWAASGQIYVRQSDPLPLSIVGMTIEVAIGG